MSQDSAIKTIGVATGICLVCSLFVSVAAVKLRPLQEKNRQLDRIINILQVADLADTGEDPMTVYRQRIQPRLVDLASGDELGPDQIDAKLDPNAFDIKALSGDPAYSRALSPEQDLAGIRRQPKAMVVYHVLEEGRLQKLILPIYGKGLWSTLYGFLALENDLTTVGGITFYEHAETPGLGGEVDNPNWKALWPGKRAFDEAGRPVLQVIKGAVNPADPAADHQIDGLSGATLTTRGLDQFIRFWLGDDGYGPYLKRLREERSDG